MDVVGAGVYGQGGSYLPPIPCFRVTLIPTSICFIGTINSKTILTRRVCTFGWFVPCRQRAATKNVSSTELVILILFGLAFHRFSTEVYRYTLTLRCCSGRNRTNFGVRKNQTKSKPQLKVCDSREDSHSSSQATITASEIEGRS